MPTPDVPAGLKERLATLFPGAVLVSGSELAPDTGAAETLKAEGYGSRFASSSATPRGSSAPSSSTPPRRTPSATTGARTAAEILLAWDTFSTVPGQVRPIDTGAVLRAAGSPPWARRASST